MLAEDLSDPISNSEVAFELDEFDLHPESIAFSETTGLFYISSMRKRKIVTYEPKTETASDWVTTDDFYDLYGVIGMKISSDGQSIWFCSSPLPQMEGYEEGGQYTPSVFRVNLSDKTMVDRFALPIGSVPGDLVLGLILNDEFYFVSNSPWSYYEGNDMLVEKIKKPQIRKIRLAD